MYTDNLHALIEKYENSLSWLYGTGRDELFKWRAMKTWQREWSRPAGEFASFADRFAAAKKDFGWFTDNSRMHPSSGVVKLWEKEPETVEGLFAALLEDTRGDVSETQRRMDAFLDGYEGLRQKYFAGNWSYKQDRHSASVYLAVNAPDFNYVYKSNNAQTMARYIGFDLRIGAGAYFSLANYYEMCRQIIEAIRQHPTLLERHFAALDEACYDDRSLHLLAFDLMYCALTYHFYTGMAVPDLGKPGKKAAAAPASSAEAERDRARRDAERQAKIDALTRELQDLEAAPDECGDISLTGVRVTSDAYGAGTVVRQEGNKITVRFAETEKTFVLDRKYPNRPRFEEEDAVVDAFTEYARRMEKIGDLKKQLKKLGQ